MPEVIRRAGIDPADIDDMIFAESHYGGGDLARYAADATGLKNVPGQSVNRHCAGSLTAIGNASAQIGSGMERVLIAGGVQSLSFTDEPAHHRPPELKFEGGGCRPPTSRHPTPRPGHVSITVGWNTAQAAGITRAEMDAWAARSPARRRRDRLGQFLDEIPAAEGRPTRRVGDRLRVDEHPPGTPPPKLAELKVLHPRSRVLDHRGQQQWHQRRMRGGVVDHAYAADKGLDVMATVRGLGCGRRHRQPGRRRGDRRCSAGPG